MSTSLTNKCIGFIGVGVMGSSIIKSLLMKSITSDQICIADKSPEKLEQLKSQYQVEVKEIAAIGKSCNVIFLAVKPQDLADVLNELKQTIQPETVVISIAAGKTIKFIEDQLQSNNSVIRAMPNTAIAVGKSMTCLCSNEQGKNRIKIAEAIFNRLGHSLTIPESQMQAATVICASGVAFWMRLIRATTQAAIQLGFDAKEAQELAMFTCEGAANLLIIN